MKRILFGIIGVTAVAASWVSLLTPQTVSALSGSDFRAGRIIDDSIFYNGTSLDSGTIQRFLESKVSNCDTNGSQNSSHWNGSAGRYYTRAEWGGANGAPAPYTCMRDLRQDIPSIGADNYCKSLQGGTSLQASEIIARVSTACGISPSVMLVLLQKEQGLVTDDWPWQAQYRAATGFACPDTAACDAQYSGFFNQVYRAARQFQMYTRLANSFNFRTGRDSNIQYNPSSNCGGAPVTIQTQATASLYNYTPYQPNSAALNNLQGTGDNCSAYGNRNFWVYYNNWFGSPTVSADALDQPAVQHRIQTVTIGTKQYVFYYDAFQRVLRLSTLNMTDNTWTHEVLDGSSATGNGRIDASIGATITAVQYNNYLQVFYYDQTHGNLRHAWTGTDGWHFENLDGDSGSNARREGDVGYNPSVTTYGNGLQLFYYDKTYGNLRHAWTNVNGWHFENLDGDSGSNARREGDVGLTSSITDYGDSLQLFYYDNSRGNLRHAWTDNTGWHFENLDGESASNARYDSNVGMNSSAVNADGTLQLYYYDSSAGNLRHAWTDNTGWHFENLDGDSGSNARRTADVGVTPSVATYSGSLLQLYYYDVTYNNLRHAWTGTDGWHFENLDGDSGSVGRENGNIGIDVNVAVTNGVINLYYYNQTNGTLKRAYADTTGWHFDNIFTSVVY